MLTRSRICCAALLALAMPIANADLQDELNARWRGAWVVVAGELYSNCDGTTTDNRISGDLISGNGRHRFEAGELARVTRVDARRRRVDVFVELAEPILIEYRDGPFTLYREARCPVELLFDFGDERTRDLGLDGVEAGFAPWLERHARFEEAERSARWNGRLRADYPADYAETLAAYEAWQREQRNRLVAARTEDSREQAAYVLAQVSSDADFGAGFAYGIAAMREDLSDDCDRLLASEPASFARDYEAPNPDWARGFEAGQELAYHIELGRRLERCYLDPADRLASID